MGFLHEHIILPLSDLLRGEQIHKYLRLLKETESWTPSQMETFQQERLRKLIIHVATKVPFYRDWFHDNNIDPYTAALDKLPIVSKAIMRQEGVHRFSADGIPDKKRIPSHSSGSTGEPFAFYTTRLSNSVNTAAKLHTWYKAGYHLGDLYVKMAYMPRPSLKKRVQDNVNRCLYIHFDSVNETLLYNTSKLIEDKKPLILRSYPLPIFLLAQYRINHPEFQHRLLRVMTTGGVLTNTFRSTIENAFGCDVIDSYSCEGTPNTYETPIHDGYNVCNYYGIIEILDNNNQPVSNGIGRVVSTDFWNTAYPFIRYDTQDCVYVENGRIKRIIGRQTEYVTSTDGTLYTTYSFMSYFEHEIEHITAFQVINHKNESITINLTVDDAFNKSDISHISDHWTTLLGKKAEVLIVDHIPLLHNNKYLSIVNEE